METAKLFVQATIVLHNLIRSNIEANDRLVFEESLGIVDSCDRCATENDTDENSTQKVSDDRDEFCRYFNEEGSVPWQFTKIYD